MNAVAVEGADTPSIKVRINGRVDAPIRLVFRPPARPRPTKTTAWASRRPARLRAHPGTQARQRYLDPRGPARQYHGGLSTAMGGGVISVPFEALDDTLAEDNETAVFTLQAPGVNGASPFIQWNMEDPVCSGTGDTVKQASYVIRNGCRRSNSAAGYTTTRTAMARLTNRKTGPRWSRWLRASTSTSCARTKSSPRRRSPRAWARISSPCPAIRTTASSCRTLPPARPHPAGLLALQRPRIGHARPAEGQEALDFGLIPHQRLLSKAFDQTRIPQGTATVIFKLKSSNNGLDQHDGLASPTCCPRAADRRQPPGRQCGAVSVSVQDGRSRAALHGRQPAQRHQQLRHPRDGARPDAGPEDHDQSNLSEVSSNLTASVNASIRVGLNYDVDGAVYRDANANGHRDAEEGGIGAALWVKLTPRAASAARPRRRRPRRPAAAITSARRRPASTARRQPGSGRYRAVHAGLVAADAGRRQLPISISNADLRDRDLGLYRGLILKGRVFRDTGTPGVSSDKTANNGIADGAKPACRAPACASRRADAPIPAPRPTPRARIRCSCPCRRTAAPPPANPSKWRRPTCKAMPPPARRCRARRSRVRPASAARNTPMTATPTSSASRPARSAVLDGLDFGDVPDSRLSHDGNLDGTPGAARPSTCSPPAAVAACA